MNATLGLLPEPRRNPTSLITSSVCNLLILGLLMLIGRAAVHHIVPQKLDMTTIYLAPSVPPPPPTKLIPRAKPLTPLPPPPKITPAPQLEQPKIQIQRPAPKPDPLPIDLPEAKSPTIQAANTPRIILAPQPKAAMNIAPVQNPPPSTNESVAAIRFGSVAGEENNQHQAVTATGLGSFRAGRTSEGYGHIAAAGLPTRIATTASSSPKMQATPSTTEVVVLSGPKPAYTDEAKQLHIQGTVILRVTVTATGRIQVLGVIRGLGHGLDQSAIKAVEEYRIKPAMRNGIPVDTTTNITITFQLA